MLESLRRCTRLIEVEGRGRWLVIIALAVVVSLLEACGALLVFIVLGAITRPHAHLVLPFLGDLQHRFPGVDETRLFRVVAACIAGFFLVRGVMALTQSYLQNRVAYNAGVSLSTRLLHGYLRMPYSWHLQRNSAELIRNSYESVAQIVAYVFVPLVALTSEALVVIGIFAVLLFKAPIVTLLAVAVLSPLVASLLRGLQPRLVALGTTHEEMAKRSLQTLQQSLHGIRDIQVIGRQGFFSDQLRKHRSKQARAQYLRATLTDVPRLTIETAVMLLMLAFLAVDRGSVGSSQRSLAVLGLFAYAVLRVMPSVNRIVTHLNTLRFGTASIDHVYDDLMLLAGAEARSAAESAERLPFSRRITLEGVRYRYPGTSDDVLHDVGLVIQFGESVGIVGPTGGGKTTLVDVVLGLLEPTSGCVRVDDVDIRDRVASWQQNLGVVPQMAFLLDDTLRSNIALGLGQDEIDEEAVVEAVRLAQLEEFVASLPEGLSTIVGERGIRLSGGQRQRVAIARALYRRPAVLVLDEGTSALDTLTEAELIRALERLRGERTVITVAHRFTTVRKCDRIVLLRAGRVVDVGGYDELIHRSAEFRQMAG